MPILAAVLLALYPVQERDYRALPPIHMEPGFVRTVDRTDGIAVSQTSARKLVAPGKPDVWLVGAAHIGLKQYYQDLQALLDAQEVVLFEGVRQKNASDRPGKIDPKAPQMIYQIIGSSIGLDFQLADIQYDRPSWINSDLTMDDLDRINKKGGGGKATEFDSVRKMLDPQSAQTKMLAGFFQSASPGMKEAFKIFLIDRLAKVDTLLATVIDPTTLNVLLGARNKSVMDVFAKTISRPEPPRTVAIFYGAAHQTDLEKALKADYGYKEVEQKWFTFAKADRRRVDSAGRQFLDVPEKTFGSS